MNACHIPLFGQFPLSVARGDIFFCVSGCWLQGLGAHKNIQGESAEWEEAVEALKGRKVPLAAIWQVGFGNEGKEAEAGHRQQMEAMSGGALAPG